MTSHAGEPDLRRRLRYRLSRILPGKKSFLLEPAIDIEHVRRWAEPVIGNHDDGDIIPGPTDEIRKRRIESVEVLLAEIDDLLLPWRRIHRLAGRVEKPPAQMLKLVRAVEDDPDEVNVVFGQQKAQYLGPALFATRMQADPVGIFLGSAALDRLGLERHIERELSRIEARQRLELVEQPRRVTTPPQLPPRHPAARDAGPGHRGGGKNSREVQGSNPASPGRSR